MSDDVNKDGPLSGPQASATQQSDSCRENLYAKRLSDGGGRPTMLPIEQIFCDSELQPREKLIRSVVREYSELMQAGEGFPALQVVAADGGFLLIDGHHRLEAAKLAKIEKIRCVVHDGDRRQAILLSSSANVRHGLRRTVADKRRAVMKLLADAKWRHWSDHQIARHCGVSQPFVSGLRPNMSELIDNVISDNLLKQEGTERRYITKHGKPAVMHLSARQRSGAVTSERIQPRTGSRTRATTKPEVVAVESMEGSRARFIEAVVHCDKVTRATDITTIRADAAADDALCGQLRTLAQLLVSKADMLGRGA